jgi:hypothetical protein
LVVWNMFDFPQYMILPSHWLIFFRWVGIPPTMQWLEGLRLTASDLSDLQVALAMSWEEQGSVQACWFSTW